MVTCDACGQIARHVPTRTKKFPSRCHIFPVFFLERLSFETPENTPIPCLLLGFILDTADFLRLLVLYGLGVKDVAIAVVIFRVFSSNKMVSTRSADQHQAVKQEPAEVKKESAEVEPMDTLEALSTVQSFQITPQLRKMVAEAEHPTIIPDETWCVEKNRWRISSSFGVFSIVSFVVTRFLWCLFCIGFLLVDSLNGCCVDQLIDWLKN